MRGMECDRGAAEQIMHGLFQNLGQSLMEILYTPKLNKDNISQYVTLEHPERLDAALKENKGVIVLTGHIGNWEWMGASLALYGYPTTTIVKKQPNDQVTRLLNENREMMGLEVFARGGNEMIIAARALKRKKYWDFWPIRTADFTAFPSPFWGRCRRRRGDRRSSPVNSDRLSCRFLRFTTNTTVTASSSARSCIMKIRGIRTKISPG